MTAAYGGLGGLSSLTGLVAGAGGAAVSSASTVGSGTSAVTSTPTTAHTPPHVAKGTMTTPSSSSSSGQGIFGDLGGTLGLAASQAASLGSSQAGSAWWAMAAQQLALQDYLNRLQSATRDPAAYASLLAQGVLPGYDMLTSGAKGSSPTPSSSSGSATAAAALSTSGSTAVASPKFQPLNIPNTSAAALRTSSHSKADRVLENLRLPSDTEIFKQTSSSSRPGAAAAAAAAAAQSAMTSDKARAEERRGRKRSLASSDSSKADSASISLKTPSIPPGLTIERKIPGQKTSSGRGGYPDGASPVVDKVEITKVPVGGATSSSSSSNGTSSSRADLLSSSSSSPYLGKGGKPGAGDHHPGGGDGPLNLSTKASPFPAAKDSVSLYNKASIPPEYYASQALSGVFLAEQIRQQQLAAALESRLDSQSFSAMQAAMLMSKLKAGAAVAAAAAAATSSTSSEAFMLSGGQSGMGPLSEQQQQQQHHLQHQLRHVRDAPKRGRGRGRGRGGTRGGGKNCGNNGALPPPQPSSGYLAAPEKLSKNTVASLLARSRASELTIEPVYQPAAAGRGGGGPERSKDPAGSSSRRDDRFDRSDDGRRLARFYEDGKLKIKTVSDSPEIRNLSDHDADGYDGYLSDEANGHHHHHANNLDLSTAASMSPNNHDGVRSSSGSKYATVETEELRYPLKVGWKRETLVREYTKSGVRGEVCYYAPCGKKFKQYPDIVRYLEKKGVRNLQRDNFSFSTKIFIGDFRKPTGQSENGEEKYTRLNEAAMIEDVEKIRRENGWKPRRKMVGNCVAVKAEGPAGSASSSSEAAKAQAGSRSDLPALNCAGASSAAGGGGGGPRGKSSSKRGFLSEEEKMLQKMVATEAQRKERDQRVLMQKEALRALKEAERQEELRKEKERQQAAVEAKRKQEEALRRYQEAEAKRQQALLAKEQEKEMRRQHMLLLRQLEYKKRSDEREKKREEMILEREKERDLRIELKRLELDIMTESRKPLEDMSIEPVPEKELPELPRIPNVALSGEAFANVLMIYEFLHNFGETLGFEMDSLPTLEGLQSAMLYDQDAEEELLSVVIHLVVCAVDDPGIPNPQKHLTLLGQNLRQADITNTNISEILGIYFFSRAQAEVRMLHGLGPPDLQPHSRDRKRDSSAAAAAAAAGDPAAAEYLVDLERRVEEYNLHLHRTRPYEMSCLVKANPFLSLNPADKSEMVAYLCNDLLSNKAVVHQIDSQFENIAKARKLRWEADCTVKKYKTVQARRLRESAITAATVAAANESLPVASAAPGGTPLTPGGAPVAVKGGGESEPPSELAVSMAGEDKDETMSEMSESATSVALNGSQPPQNATSDPASTIKKPKGRPPKKRGRGRSAKGSKKSKRDDDDQEDQLHGEDNDLCPDDNDAPPAAAVNDDDDNDDDEVGDEDNHASFNGSASAGTVQPPSRPADQATTASTVPPSPVAALLVSGGAFEDEDDKLSPEELQKKIDKSTKQLNKRRDELTFSMNCLRCNNMGQDRYRRRFWYLAHCDGIYVEGMESAEPWKLRSRGLSSGDPQGDQDEESDGAEDEGQGQDDQGPGQDDEGSPDAKKVKLDKVDRDDDGSSEDLTNGSQGPASRRRARFATKSEVAAASSGGTCDEAADSLTKATVEAKLEVDGDDGVKESEDHDVDVDDKEDVENALKKLSSDVSVTTRSPQPPTPTLSSVEVKDEKLAKAEPDDVDEVGFGSEKHSPHLARVPDRVRELMRRYSPKATPNGDKLNMFNHSTFFNMTLNPVVLNGSVTITPKEAGNHSGSLPPPPPPPIGKISPLLNVPTVPPADAGSVLKAEPQEAPFEKPWFSIVPLDDPVSIPVPVANFISSGGTIGNVGNVIGGVVPQNPWGSPVPVHQHQQAIVGAGPATASTPVSATAPPGLSTPTTPTTTTAAPVPQSTAAVLAAQIELLEAKLSDARSRNSGLKRKPVPEEFAFGWWKPTKAQEITDLEASLNYKGIREQHLMITLRRNMEVFQDGAKKSLPEGIALSVPKGHKLEMMDYGAPKPDVPGDWSHHVALRVEKYVLEQVEALEDKVAAASMQVPGWKLPSRPDIEQRNFRPSSLPKNAENDRLFGKDATNPVDEARERLLDLEAAIERRYLKAPLGQSNSDISLQTITSSITKNSVRESARNGGAAGHDADSGSKSGDKTSYSDPEDDEAEEDESAEKEVLPKGLVTWREGVRRATTAAQVAMGFYVLETSIAWHKSIMKAYCQICHCGDNEDSLLLCDGCDKGYHTYCFKPVLENVPEGDWYCYECINKATNLKHCLVCGKTGGKNMVLCTACPRSYHTDCITPPLSKVPRGKWMCPGCNQKGPKKPSKSSSKKKKSTPQQQQPDAEDSSSTNNSFSIGCSTVQNNHDESTTESATPSVSLTTTATPAATAAAAATTPLTSKPGKLQQLQQQHQQEVDHASTKAGAEDVDGSPANAAASKTSGKKETRGRKPGPETKRRKLLKDLTICTTMISEMEAHEEAGPFMFPVNTKQFPTYKKIIKSPIDITSIKKKLDLAPGAAGAYGNRDEFVEDVRLIFANCEMFNEDDSPVGKAGHNLKAFFENRWQELTG